MNSSHLHIKFAAIVKRPFRPHGYIYRSEGSADQRHPRGSVVHRVLAILPVTRTTGISDHASYQAHLPRALATIARFGGRIAAGGGQIDSLEGDPMPERIFII